MFCPTCGSQIQEGTNFCPNCGSQVGAAAVPTQQTQYAQPAQYAQPVEVKDYWIYNIIATIFCCPLTGLIGVIYSAKAQKAAARGDAESANSAAGTAKFWFWFSIISWAVFVGAYFYIGVVLGPEVIRRCGAGF